MSLQTDVKNTLSAQVCDLLDLLRQKQNGPHRLNQPVALIGPGDATQEECDAAYLMAACLADAGVSIVCGGRGGVMQAASKGAFEAGGTSIGILPEEDTRAANPYLSVALPTGMGEMRNALIARSALCLIAVGSNLGTISEMAMGLKWGKPLFTLRAAVHLEGAKDFVDAQTLLTAVANCLISLRQT